MAATPSLSLREVTEQLAAELQQRGWLLATAESCTGGLIAAACTDLPGSSAWFDRGFVTYSNAAKTDMLGVPATLIAAHGAVSEEVVRAMAAGAVARSAAHVSIAVSGVAGPDGGSADKPVGTVWIAWCLGTECQATRFHLQGTRNDVRQQTLCTALQRLVTLIQVQ